MKTILVTGSAGFIGSALVERLLARGDRVVGLDNFNHYYDPALKEARHARILAQPAGSDPERFRLVRMGLEDRSAMQALFAETRFDGVVNLAAQAGVRYSLENPQAYVDSNITGFLNILEGVRAQANPELHLVYASSSSVYGGNRQLPFSEAQRVDHPVSLYAATKKANELMAHTYSHLFGIPATGLRFFTVYGPWGRPDMAPFKFVRAILAGEPIDIYNHGQMQRDFTYIDDIVEGVVQVLDRPPRPQPGGEDFAFDQAAAHRVLNIGNHQPEPLMGFVAAIEAALGKTAEKRMLPMQPGDVPATYADTESLKAITGFQPNTPLEQGVQAFVDWYRSHYRV